MVLKFQGKFYDFIAPKNFPLESLEATIGYNGVMIGLKKSKAKASLMAGKLAASKDRNLSHIEIKL